ncbi:MerR family transcriptional regulator [Dictyobacter kobayashii]|uniref:MerR family transcriptional regulator n=1 Tax=Dictyobacter kobayashii TaxID=2014872 RepID=UPI0013866B99|nr:MerR family transcriptional regulator [Dictyobacter kobayashii]
MRSKQSIQEHLQKEDVQERILQNIHRGRDEATVTISRAAELFGITENKLRDWEEYGFLNPLRPGGPKGRRLYTPTELDKLAIIRELINAGYSASDIPADIDKLWLTIRSLRETVPTTNPAKQSSSTNQLSAVDELSINQRVTQGRDALFWDYFISRALRIALKLICENIPNTTAGLILPLSPEAKVQSIRRVEDLETLGESLVGWLSQSGSSYTLLTPRPWFQYTSDFRVEPLQEMRAGIPQTTQTSDRTLIILQRETSPLTLSSEVVETIHRLLEPLYAEVACVRSCLGPGMRDNVNPATDLYNNMNYDDTILNGLADMVIRLGGTTPSGQPRWRFCWVLLPRDISQPTNMSHMTLRAQNQDARYTTRLPLSGLDKHTNYPYIRALHSRHIIYEPNIPSSDTQAILGDLDAPLRSSIALPISGEDGLPLGVLYVSSHLRDAFAPNYQRLLRIICRMAEELLKTYWIRQQGIQHLSNIIKHPAIIDTLFENFPSEHDFNKDVETLLGSLQTGTRNKGSKDKLADKVVSFIALDIDKYSSLANKYGERLARNLTREVGLRIQEQIRTFFKEYPECQLYHIYADRFFILLKNTSLDQTREHAERLRIGAMGSYKLDALRVFADQQSRPESLLELTDITVRFGITSYPYPKLDEILHEHAAEYAIPEVRSIITSALDVALVKGQIEGGNVVVSWDYEQRNFIRWSPPRAK